ncbi:DUF3397 domain-containing protein [Paenibacillus sp. GCM10012307]|uniref:DUF3397 domain-containing protein n=1 Tax=Paenibacillus roseus TaxID=2798579 RepID=A0A934MMC1_9BACL|nr:DUF3397 domain-containing protein [Paenibacillus roseus]MBJ6363145.1 DUF3397 domain-containing protein [Paenibacillus roseus]
MQWLVKAYAFLAAVPIIPFFIIYFSAKAATGNKKKAFRLAMDITTALLIGCVAVLFDMVFKSSFGIFGILLLLLIGGGLMGNLQHRTKGVLDLKRVTRAVWRLSFFMMSAMYILLMLIGIGQSFARV